MTPKELRERRRERDAKKHSTAQRTRYLQKMMARECFLYPDGSLSFPVGHPSDRSGHTTE